MADERTESPAYEIVEVGSWSQNGIDELFGSQKEPSQTNCTDRLPQNPMIEPYYSGGAKANYKSKLDA
ncbi:hypothetical protein Pla52n_20090 [Stieleria varia]|uniref:Uncharacterized protein n=1 Tax=Stieleria varia TaxID=2528005 RepID=A0A5C6B2W8_9BACT|nr:hypothetical protein Pla52n_20090 [Stieleria varia]